MSVTARQLVFTCTFLTSTMANAQATSPACNSPWVRVSVTGVEQPRADDFVKLLRAELATRHIDVCEAGPGDPIGTIDLSAGEDGANLDVEVHDAITAKHVRREVPLASLPADGVPLALALSADELLRASWAELELKDAPAPRAPVPPEVVRANAESIERTPPPRPAPRRVSFALSGAAEYYRAGTTLFGADVSAGFSVVPRVRLGLRFGARSGLPVQPRDGRIDVSALVGGLAGAVTLTRPGLREGLDAVLRFGFAHATFTANPSGSARAVSPASDWAILADAGLQGWISVVPALRVAGTLLASFPLRPVEATDGGTVVSGIGGIIGVAGSLDLVGMF